MSHSTDAENNNLVEPNAEKSYVVSRDSLPLSCPTPEMHLWNSHPRVYLPIEATGHAKCPYCGAEFHLEGVESESA